MSLMQKLKTIRWGSLFFAVFGLIGVLVSGVDVLRGGLDIKALGGVAFGAAILAFYGHRFLTSLRPKPSQRDEHAVIIRFTPTHIAIHSAAGEHKAIEWAQLSRVEIVTTDEGPFVDDVFWGLHTASGDVLAFPNSATGTQDLLQAMMERLDGFDIRQLVEAMGSTVNAQFSLWQKGGVVSKA